VDQAASEITRVIHTANVAGTVNTMWGGEPGMTDEELEAELEALLCLGGDTAAAAPAAAAAAAATDASLVAKDDLGARLEKEAPRTPLSAAKDSHHRRAPNSWDDDPWAESDNKQPPPQREAEGGAYARMMMMQAS
jgi:hypothetical protein